ncbi:hypothetical protein [Actinomadura sp. DC4]|uniref:hypothetical protein n=1 Tax=Actinomadura sp. DC4 TaxID=3055069 RepID=UPI0025B0E723|nr:hypothetical protein [Actinomadura sp. DC4]MDN3352357.1 hypothetical protein [Actinomadura sp. DC4]
MITDTVMITGSPARMTRLGVNDGALRADVGVLVPGPAAVPDGRPVGNRPSRAGHPLNARDRRPAGPGERSWPAARPYGQVTRAGDRRDRPGDDQGRQCAQAD